MTNNKERSECGIPENKVGDKHTFVNKETGEKEEKTFVKEKVYRDSNGNIIGVEKEWQ